MIDFFGSMLIASNYKGVILEAKHTEIVAFKIRQTDILIREITHLQTAKTWSSTHINIIRTGLIPKVRMTEETYRGRVGDAKRPLFYPR